MYSNANLHSALIIKIFRTFKTQTTFSFGKNSITVSVVFGWYCLSLRAIIWTITRDNRLLDGCFGKLKQLFIGSVTYFDLKSQILAVQSAKKFYVFEKIYAHFMMSSFHHKTKFWVSFLQSRKETIIYWMEGCDKTYLQWFVSYNSPKRSILVAEGTLLTGIVRSSWSLYRVVCAIVGWCYEGSMV